MVNKNFFLTKLNCLIDVPYHEWHKHNVNLVRVRTNSSGQVSSGIALEANQLIWFKSQKLLSLKLPNLFILDQ